MKRRFQLWASLLAFVLVPGQRAGADSSYVVDAWSTDDRLPQSSVITIAQSHDGYLWLGTLNGLVRFDGNSMTPINVNNAPGLPDNFVSFLFADSRSNLWIGTGNGSLCIVQNGTIKTFDIAGAGGKVVFAEDDASGGVHFLTSGGKFFSVKDGRVNLAPVIPPARNMAYRYFHTELPGKNGVTWKLGDRVQKFQGAELVKDFGPCPWTNSMVFAPYRLPDGSFLSLSFDVHVTALCEDRDGNLVVGTHDAGVYWFDASGGFSHIPTDKGRSHDNVLSLCCDHEGNLWVGTDGDGLERISKKLFSEPPEYVPGVAISIAEDAAGGIWTAYNRGGLVYALTNTTQKFHIGREANAYSDNAWTVFVDRQQQVWAGTRDKELFRLQNGGFQPVPASAAIGKQIFALFQSADGTLWAGGQGGFACLDGQKWRVSAPPAGQSSYGVRAFAEDGNSNVWIGTDTSGILLWRDEKISPLNAPVSDISCLLAGHGGVMWVGTSGHGLARYHQGHWTRYSSGDGLGVDDIGYLIEDEFTNLWIGSYEGILRVEEKSLADFAAGNVKKISCRTLLTRECTGAQPAAIRTRDRRLLFPTIDGLVSIDPQTLRPNTNPPPVVIESVLVDGTPQQGGPLMSAWPESIVLQPQNEQLDIHFTALNFSAPKGAQLGTRLRYQLEGRDKKPTDIGAERVAHFGKLPPGDYVFRVTAGNEDGYWNNTGATIPITVRPPFWRTPGFMAGSALLFLGALAGTIYLISTAKLRRQLRAAQQKELIEHERARIARDLHDQLGANLTQITLLGEMAESDKEQPAEVEEHAQQICATARETTRSLDEIVWAVNPSNDTLESLANYACKYAQDYFAMAGVSYRAELPPGLPPTPILPEVRHNVFLAFKEAVNNVVKHARATEARVKLQLEPDRFVLSVTDNGRGLGDISGKALRNGMKNMRRRLADVHGEFDIAPGPAGGTVVKLTVPVKNEE